MADQDMYMNTFSRFMAAAGIVLLLAACGGGGDAAVAGAEAKPQQTYKWRMVTTWPKNLPWKWVNSPSQTRPPRTASSTTDRSGVAGRPHRCR